MHLQVVSMMALPTEVGSDDSTSNKRRLQEARSSQMCVEGRVCERPQGVDHQGADCDVCKAKLLRNCSTLYSGIGQRRNGAVTVHARYQVRGAVGARTWHKSAVHNIDVNPLCTSIDDSGHLNSSVLQP